MKLKFLMMPTVIIISISIVIWYIWPIWFSENLKESIVSVQEDIKTEQSEFDRIKQRKSNIISLNQSLQSQSENRKLIFNYYPMVREEENIINKINHVAFSAGIYIADLNVDYGKNSINEDLDKVLAIPKSKLNDQAVNTESASSTQLSTIKKSVQMAIPGLISVELKTYGNYDQVKNFLNSLYAIGLLNNIQSFEIKKGDAKKKGAVEDNMEESSLMLTSNIIINFGYLKKKNNTISNLLEDPLFVTSHFDFKDIDEYRNMVLAKYPNSEVGETGESNPFSP